MNAKELREAAYRRWKQAHKELIDYELEDHDDPGMKSHWEDMLEMSRHILATVRDDDDEPVTAEWLVSVGIIYSEFHDVFYSEDEAIELVQHSQEFMIREADASLGVTVKTRGQFRRLCEGLGITLKEKAT